ncbi:hypothetical protein [Actinomadura sp. WAC 06369]|uniref:hypothetical protein n=1 Tax=Actinomadura sp. WAC 06369 TaxID=2203193 RepID=UPI0018F43359|nr:hypothetical protein [Actinomadura sp. WAC 06369]
MNGIIAAFSATALYYLGFAVFKLAADRMAVLRGNRILHMIWTILGNWVFLIGLGLVLGGLSLQIVALSKLSLPTAVPIFMSGIVPLLVIALAFFGERLTAREWLSLVLTGAAILLLAASVVGDDPISSADAPAWKLGLVLAPSVLVPLLILVVGDHRPDGRHARPVTGIAYGVASGLPVGTAEIAIKGWSDHAHRADLGILATPWPYLTVLAAAIGFGIMVAAFQRCRVAIVSTVMTVCAKSYLLIMGTFVYGQPWPDEADRSAMRIAALALAAVAVLQFPRHRPVADAAREAAREREAAARDPFGATSAGGPALGDRGFAGRGFGGPGPGAAEPVLGAPAFEEYGEGYGEERGGEPPWLREPPRPGPFAQDPLGRGPSGRWSADVPPPRPPEAPEEGHRGQNGDRNRRR